MGQTKIICIGCPKGCPITVTYEDKTITNIEEIMEEVIEHMNDNATLEK